MFAWSWLLLACGEPGTPPEVVAEEPGLDHLVASLQGRGGHRDVRGEVTLEPVPRGGLRVVAHVSGLTPGSHVLEGDCATVGSVGAGTASLGHLDVDERGEALLRNMVQDAAVGDPTALVGCPVVVRTPDGAEVACGVLGAPPPSI